MFFKLLYRGNLISLDKEEAVFPSKQELDSQPLLSNQMLLISHLVPTNGPMLV